MDKKELISYCEKNNVQFIHLWFCDLFGYLKSVTVPLSKFEKKVEAGIWFDGSSIEGFTRVAESDMYLMPDFSTFTLVPWENENPFKVGKIICDVYSPDGKLFEGSPRYILGKQVEQAAIKGYEYCVGTELEFYFIKKDDNGNPLPIDKGGYFDYINHNAIQIQEEIMHMLALVGINVESFHHEVGNGQFEITLVKSDPILQADSVMFTRAALKAIARKYGLYCTFMPKPFSGKAGSGMHIHQSLRKDGKNAFYNKKGNYYLSDIAKFFIGGQLKHSLGFSLITNPIVNSYKRLVTGYEAPVYVAWAQRNRSVLIRVPGTQNPEQSVRCEIRSPDGSSNPYLVYAVLLASGLDGVQKKEASPKFVDDNLFELNEEKAKRMRIKSLPTSLRSAIQKLETNELIQNVLGIEVTKKIIEFKLQEVSQFDNYISGWEINKYL